MYAGRGGGMPAYGNSGTADSVGVCAARLEDHEFGLCWVSVEAIECQPLFDGGECVVGFPSGSKGGGRHCKDGPIVNIQREVPVCP